MTELAQIDLLWIARWSHRPPLNEKGRARLRLLKRIKDEWGNRLSAARKQAPKSDSQLSYGELVSYYCEARDRARAHAGWIPPLPRPPRIISERTQRRREAHQRRKELA